MGNCYRSDFHVHFKGLGHKLNVLNGELWFPIRFFSFLLQLCTSVGDPIRGLFIKKQKEQLFKNGPFEEKVEKKTCFPPNAAQCHLRKSLIFVSFRTLQFLK